MARPTSSSANSTARAATTVPPPVPNSVIPNSSPSVRWAAQLASSSSVPPSASRMKTVARSSTSNVFAPLDPVLSEVALEPNPALPSRS